MPENEKKEACCCCAHKTKHRSEEEYKSLVHRLNRIEGQIRGIRGMVENEAYCPDILVQSAAVTAAQIISAPVWRMISVPGMTKLWMSC